MRETLGRGTIHACVPRESWGGLLAMLSILSVNLTRVTCRLEPISASRVEAVKVAWCQEEPGGEKRGVPGAIWCCLPSPGSSQPLRVTVPSLFNLLFAVCQGKSPLKKDQQLSRHEWVKWRRRWVPLGGLCAPPVWSEAWQCPLSGPPALNLGPCDLFLPVGPFPQCPSQASYSYHHPWLPEHITTLVCPGVGEGEAQGLLCLQSLPVQELEATSQGVCVCARAPTRFASQVSPRNWVCRWAPTPIQFLGLFFRNQTLLGLPVGPFLSAHLPLPSPPLSCVLGPLLSTPGKKG